MSEAGIEVRTTDVAGAAGRVELDGRPLTELSAALTKQASFQRELLAALEGAVETTATALADDLVGADVTALATSVAGGQPTHIYSSLAGQAAVDQHHTRATFLRVTQQLGQRTQLSIQSDTEDIWTSYPRVFATVEATPTIGVEITAEFLDQDAAQRRDICRWLAELASGCEVLIVGSPIDVERLAQLHGHDLPAEFSDWTNAGRTQDTPIEEAVATAATQLDPDGRGVQILRDLAAEPAEMLSYDELQAQHDVTVGRISDLVGRLQELDLLQKTGSRGNMRIELSPAGSAFLDHLDLEVGVQQELDAKFSEARQSHDRPCNHAGKRGAPSSAGPYRTRYLSRPQHVAAAALATDGGVTVAEEDVTAGQTADDEADEAHVRYVSYEDDADEAVVAVRATSALQYITSVAIGLASPRLIDRTLPTDRLEDLDLSPELLRGARCIGALSDEAADDPETFRDALVEWGEELADLTTDLSNQQYEDRDGLRSTIMRSAHGLAGTMVHLLDVAGVDVVRELRIPEHIDDRRLAAIAETISLAATIQSHYSKHALYRKLFETRDEKLSQTLSVTVDAADPLGSYIGGLVIRGRRATRLGYHVQGHLARRTPRDDAPEIAVDVPVATAGREHYTAALNRMLNPKHIHTTRDAVTLCRALTDSVHATCDAVHWLDSEDRPRDIGLDEVRVSLANLDPARILPNCPPTVSKVVSVMLRTAGTLSKSELADAADVSTRSVGRHLDALEALDLVRQTDDGLRLALPIDSSERGDVCPSPVSDTTAAPQDNLFDIAMALVDDTSRLVDPDQPLGAAFQWPVDLDALRRHCPQLQPWVDVAMALTDSIESEAETVRVGATVRQTSLQASATGGATVDD
ncbi:hypothetical protein EGH21_22295 [Halomicroarcula sp. F13]|uniref:Uncharacterized protein n=1 Tax=Haloarcula rubra TaxID=2487747 RepID=A0AAW4PWQ7_9EURY|nr:hypothetical protein [Halomicroarcula rubra]MBX0325751.1 hypothetical protein [Halomicroarcula rubra]